LTARDRGAWRLPRTRGFTAASAALRDTIHSIVRHEPEFSEFAWHERSVVQSVCRGVNPLIPFGLTCFAHLASRPEARH
jgi:hypothetical protein